MSSSPVAASFLASDPLRFNLNFSTPGENGPVQTLLLSAQQTSSSDEMAAESEASKESTPSIANMGCVPGESSGTPTLLPNGKKTKGRVKIKMEYIGNKLRRYTTFSKRKTGIMKKAHELSTLTGTQVMLLVASETGHVYAFATNKLKPMIASDQGKNLIQSCLNSPDEGLASLDAIKTEFTFEPPAGCGLPPSNTRKR
ncbi:Serum response factor, partial [Aphelenchoides avenae]